MAAASEAHLRAIARFVVAFGTEEDPDWRDYHFDFCGDPIKYDQNGVPYEIVPVGKSGYSVGSIQLDFGQTHAAVDPFLASFEAWVAATPGAPPLRSSHADAVIALKADGNFLAAHPDKGLRKQDVEALSAYVLSLAGSDWVNTHIDNELIGGDAHHRNVYDPSEATMIGVARDSLEATACFRHYSGQPGAVRDVLYAMTMKLHNQNPTNCATKLLPFLSTVQPEHDIDVWPDTAGLSAAQRDGQHNAAERAKFFWRLANSTEPWVRNLVTVMDTMHDANPRTASATNGAYVAAKVAYADWKVFENFIDAIGGRWGGNYRPYGYFENDGRIKIKDKTKLIREGVLVRNRIGWVWNTAGNAYKFENNAWTSVPIGDIRSPAASVDRLFEFVRRLWLPS